MFRINNLKAPLNSSITDIKRQVAESIKLNPDNIYDFTIAKKSIDARNKNNVHFVYSVDFNAENVIINKNIEKLPNVEPLNFSIKKTSIRPIVIGSGPAGMFAGLALAEAGLNPIIIERGAQLEERQHDVDKFWKTGILNKESNVQFGEGGAGTFSDGKLTTGIKKNKFTAKVLYELYNAGAPAEILYLAKPHIGTDNLRIVVKNIRQKIQKLGGEYRFNSTLIGLVIKNEQLKAVKIKHQNQVYEMPADRLFLAIGHSARDTFEMLYKSGVYMQQKPFAVGARIEHNQKMINKAQYGKYADSPYLGAADYKMAIHLPNNRSVYTFCMCPGGEVVPAASEPGRVCVNGASPSSRNYVNSNAALLAAVTLPAVILIHGQLEEVVGIEFILIVRPLVTVVAHKTST